MRSEKLNTPSPHWRALKVVPSPTWLYSFRVPSHLLLQVSVLLSCLSPSLTQRWCHCPCRAPMPSCACFPGLPWCYRVPTLMWLFKRMRWCLHFPDTSGFLGKPVVIRGSQVCGVKEMKKQAPLFLPGAAFPTPHTDNKHQSGTNDWSLAALLAYIKGFTWCPRNC